ncbi:MAG: UDP-glucose 4-epimerase GalE, partial [Alphaproteobacteria bacterium]|nr:UDP-glucose 4-epimerase GalE [Alphaproteobacteria bacterium]
CQVLNCGYGLGYSVREVLGIVEEVTGRMLDIRSAPRRPADSSALVADATRIRNVLGWRPRYNDPKKIVESALRWERALAEKRKAAQK